MAQSQQSMTNFDSLRETLQKNPSPDNNYESAVFLISNSELTEDAPEIEKEFKLANLKTDEKNNIQAYLNSYQDLDMLHQLQTLKFKSKFSSKEFKQFQQDNPRLKFDQLNFLRRAISLATVSRGTEGFERKSQNTIISKSDLNTDLGSSKQSTFSKIINGGQG